MRALAEAGPRVPEDVAVVGFDDQPGASANVPPLATISYPLAEAGRRRSRSSSTASVAAHPWTW